ncbi:MAG: hypothetical protein U1F52_19070 [Burkholderiales bacterium]
MRSCTRLPETGTTTDRIIATLEDYAVVRDLVVDAIEEGVDASVSESVRRRYRR